MHTCTSRPSADIPEHDDFDKYRPGFSLTVPALHTPNRNTKDYLADVANKALTVIARMGGGGGAVAGGKRTAESSESGAESGGSAEESDEGETKPPPKRQASRESETKPK